MYPSQLEEARINANYYLNKLRNGPFKTFIKRLKDENIPKEKSTRHVITENIEDGKYKGLNVRNIDTQ